MRIGIDARMVEHSGIGTYIRELVRAYRVVDEINDYVLLGDPGKLRGLSEGERFSTRRVGAGIYGVREQIEFPLQIQDIQLLHSPHYNTPLMATPPVVVTVHDLIHLIFPEYLRSPAHRLYARFLLGRACQKARKIITGSQNSQEDIVERLGVKPEKVQVIPYGVASHFRPIADEEVKSRYMRARSLPDRYVLYVGNNKLHKNLHTLVRAFHGLGGGVRDLYTLVLTGERNPRDGALGRAISELGGEKVIFLGYVPEEEMPLLYNCASLFVYPSRYEGFGLPPLEGMACGIPVISSNASSLPEVVADGAVLVPPEDVGALTEAMRRLLTDEDLRVRLAQRGLKRARQFPWDKAARKTVAVYREAVEG